MKTLSLQEQESLLQQLETRFHDNTNRHKNIAWSAVHAKLNAQPQKLWSLHQMEITGGEPDVVDYDTNTDEYIFFDCAAESPKERRSVCYDPEALASRKKHKPKNSAVGMASDMGITLLTEAQYRSLQQLGEFDTKTSSWLQTPTSIRERGGAIFGDFRFGTIFVYHNGVESYYATRGFRGVLRV